MGAGGQKDQGMIGRLELLNPSSDSPLGKGMATHSSILAWRIPWTEEPGRQQSMGLQRVGHDWASFIHSVTSRERKGSGDWLLLPMAKDSINYAYIMEPTIKTLDDGVWRAFRFVSTSRCWEGGEPRKDVEALQPLPPPSLPPLVLRVSSIWLFLSSTFYNKPVNVNKELFWILWAILANY